MDIWKHGKYIDLWSVVHFLSGFVLAGLWYVFGFGFIPAIVGSIFLLLLWEIVEEVTKIIEPSINVIFDIITGFLGFLFGAYIFYIKSESLIYLYAALVLSVSLGVWGFLDFLKRGYR